jgi:hypothetical protein
MQKFSAEEAARSINASRAAIARVDRGILGRPNIHIVEPVQSPDKSEPWCAPEPRVDTRTRHEMIDERFARDLAEDAAERERERQKHAGHARADAATEQLSAADIDRRIASALSEAQASHEEAFGFAIGEIRQQMWREINAKLQLLEIQIVKQEATIERQNASIAKLRLQIVEAGVDRKAIVDLPALPTRWQQ